MVKGVAIKVSQACLTQGSQATKALPESVTALCQLRQDLDGVELAQNVGSVLDFGQQPLEESLSRDPKDKMKIL